MATGATAGVLFGRTYRQPDGTDIRFRLAGPGDQIGVVRLFQAAGAQVRELELVRLLRSDPRQHAVICATALIDGRETILGFAAAAFGELTQPDSDLVGNASTVVVAPSAGAELRALLVQALESRLGAGRRAA